MTMLSIFEESFFFFEKYELPEVDLIKQTDNYLANEQMHLLKINGCAQNVKWS